MSTCPTASEIRVLIAEDDALVAALTQAELQSLGYTVVGTAPNGRRVGEMVLELKPTVVLMDIGLPLIDGITAAALIQETGPTPVVILTAHPDHANVLKATAAGVGAFVVKPPQAAELERAITIAVARHADLMALRRVNTRLEQALVEVKTLRGFLPICCSCKKIRDDKGYWEQVEVYVMKHSDAKFTHGYCPTCMEKFFPGFAQDT